MRRGLFSRPRTWVVILMAMGLFAGADAFYLLRVRQLLDHHDRVLIQEATTRLLTSSAGLDHSLIDERCQESEIKMAFLALQPAPPRPRTIHVDRIRRVERDSYHSRAYPESGIYSTGMRWSLRADVVRFEIRYQSKTGEPILLFGEACITSGDREWSRRILCLDFQTTPYPAGRFPVCTSGISMK